MWTAYSSTSSARNRIEGGTVRPSALAVWRVDSHLHFVRKLNGKVRRLCAAQNAIDVRRRTAKYILGIFSIGNQTTHLHINGFCVHRWYGVPRRQRHNLRAMDQIKTIRHDNEAICILGLKRRKDAVDFDVVVNRRGDRRHLERAGGGFKCRHVVIPLGFASLMSGLVSSFVTDWGLLRHYCVVVTLLLTTPAIILMLVHIQPVRRAAHAAATTISSRADLAGLRLQLVAEASAALIVLLVATALSTYKPRGRIRYGTRD
jgi:hypothetical protein